MNGEGQAQVRPIGLGQSLGADWVVTGGLAAGDRVVTEGVIKVRPGQPVRTASAPEGAQ